MPKFPPECIQRLRDAGLEVHNASYDELEDHEVNDYRGRLNVVHESHRIWMFSHDNQWCVEYHGPSPGDFVALFDTPEEAVVDALAFFAGDERWKLIESFFHYTEHKLPSRLLEKASADGFRWERMAATQGYEFFKGDNPTSVQVCKRGAENIWETIYFDEEPRTESKQWTTADDAVEEAIRFLTHI